MRTTPRIIGAITLFVLVVLTIYLIWPCGKRQELSVGGQIYLNDSAADNFVCQSNQVEYSHIDSNRFIIEFSASEFSPSPQEACERLSDSIKFRQVSDGRFVSQEDLPLAVQETVARLCIVVPNLDCNATELKSMLRFFYVLQNETNPKRTQSEGLVHKKRPPDEYLIEKDKEAEIFFNKLPINAALNCSLNDVILLELYERLSSAAKIDIGFSPDGQYVIGYDGEWASSNTPAYLLVFPSGK